VKGLGLKLQGLELRVKGQGVKVIILGFRV
jgi:hypothetical protein